MPTPSTEPVPVRLLDEIVTTLGAIVQGANFWYTIASSEVADVGQFDVEDFPAFRVVGGGTVDDETELHNKQVTLWNISLVGFLQERDDQPKKILRLVYDCHRALMVDITRGGLAIDTKWRGWTPIYPVDEEDLETVVDIRIQIHFRTSDTDMSVPA